MVHPMESYHAGLTCMIGCFVSQLCWFNTAIIAVDHAIHVASEQCKSPRAAL